MRRTELETLAAELNNELAYQQRLGDFNANAASIRFLTKCVTVMARHLIEVDKELAKIKRTPAFKKIHGNK